MLVTVENDLMLPGMMEKVLASLGFQLKVTLGSLLKARYCLSCSPRQSLGFTELDLVSLDFLLDLRLKDSCLFVLLDVEFAVPYALIYNRKAAKMAKN